MNRLVKFTFEFQSINVQMNLNLMYDNLSGLRFLMNSELHKSSMKKRKKKSINKSRFMYLQMSLNVLLIHFLIMMIMIIAPKVS